jgi:diguanylate cyclase
MLTPNRLIKLITLLCLLLLGASLAFAQGLRGSSPLILSDGLSSVKPWPYVSLHIDADGKLGPEDLLARPQLLSPTQAPDGALGSQVHPVWLHIPIQVSTGSDGHWIVDIDYHPIVTLDIYLISNGRIVQTTQMGTARPFEARQLNSRSYAMPMELKAGQDYELLVRAAMQGGMVLPITLHKPAAFHAKALAEQMLQGLILGIGLCLILYSLGQWLSLRESLFGKYALLTFGSLLFCMFLFGVGSQYLWKNHQWAELHVGVLAALCASCGSFLFNEHSLRGPGTKPWFAWVMKGGAALCIVLAIIYSLDIFNNRIMTAIISLIGTVPALLGIPIAAKRALERDALGAALVLAWIAYGTAAAVLIALFAGKLPANFWTLHSFEIGATIDMFAFMYVLSLRTRAVRMAASRASQERDMMRSLAHTDPLTGLANRRSLNESLEAALRHSTADNMLAVYVIDVDGFKPVNDRFGHDTGDELLVSIARRLKSHTRNSDVVARMGGDEFVIIATGIREQRLAFELGSKLVDVFNEPFQLRLGVAHIGLTIGYALAPADASDAATLLKIADAAMYEGKQEGKRCLRRAKAASSAPSSRLRTVTNSS